MAHSTYGYTDTNAASPLSFNDIPKLAYAADFAVKKLGENEAVLVNVTTPVNQIESIRFATQDIKNIYSGSEIDPVLYAPIKKGKSIVASLQDTAVITNETTNVSHAYPVKAHFVLQVPNTDEISVQDCMDVVKRMFALAFDGSNGNSRLTELLRGVVNPNQ